MKPDFTNPSEVVRDYCFDDTNLSYPVQQIRRFVAELGAVALHHVLTKHPHRQQRESMEDLDYCFHTMTYNTFTDQPHLLAQHMTDWFFWLKESEILHEFTPYPHLKDHLLLKDLTERLSTSSGESGSMAIFLLERGMPAKELNTEKAIEYLMVHYFIRDEGYIRSFFCPPPYLFWEGQCFHWLYKSYPESPLLYSCDVSLPSPH